MRVTRGLGVVQFFVHFQLNDMATFDFTADMENSVENLDSVIQKLPETNTNNVEKIMDETSNMARNALTSAATEVGLWVFFLVLPTFMDYPMKPFFIKIPNFWARLCNLNLFFCHLWTVVEK